MFPIKKQGLCQHLFILLFLAACQPAATNLPAETAVAHPTAISHTATALYVYRDGEWIAEQQGSATILGEDDEDRVWVLLDDTLAVYTAAAGWQRYGPAWDTPALNNPEDNVSGLAVDHQGRVWFAGPKNDLWSGSDDFMRYAPDSGWEWLPVPENEELFGERPSFVSRIWLDDGGAPWLFVERRGGASFPAPGLYFEQNGRWQTVADELGGSIAFGANAQAWVWAWDMLVVGDDVLTGLQRFQNGVWTTVPTPPGLLP